MDIGVPSRFACLKIEDDDNWTQAGKSKEAKKKTEIKSALKKTVTNAKPEKNGKNKKPTLDKQTSEPAISTKRKKNANCEQWEEWKLKDDELVNGNYEQDLQNAILLSKLDYEHNKDVNKKIKQNNGNASQQLQNKKKKNKTMSINEFLSSGNGKRNSVTSNSETNVKVGNGVKEERFFDDIKNATKEELNKEQITEKRKKREVNIDKIISLAQCQEKLEQEKSKRYVLQMALDKAKAEIVTVKERNKTLCGILGHGEMKDKADVLVELEKLYSEKNELTEEVTRLHVLLEQERSKVAALTSESHNNKHKDKKRKQKGT